jgi:hypothetical protein
VVVVVTVVLPPIPPPPVLVVVTVVVPAVPPPPSPPSTTTSGSQPIRSARLTTAVAHPYPARAFMAGSYSKKRADSLSRKFAGLSAW